MDRDQWVALFADNFDAFPSRTTVIDREGDHYPQVRSVEDGLVLGDPNILAHIHDGTLFLILESTSYVDRRIELRRLTSLYQPPSELSIGTLPKAAPLCCEWSNNYWHWMTEYLPYVLDLEAVGYDGVYLVPAGGGMVRQTLRFFGVPDEKIVERDRDLYLIGDMCVPDRSEGQKAGHPALIRRLRDIARDRLGAAATPTRLYIARRDQRVVRNEAEVLAVLAPFGFSTVYMEDHPIEEQIGMALAADGICGPHGAGMTATMFMADGGKIIELFAPTYVNPCMLGTSEVLGQTYAMVTSRVFREAAYPYGLDILVDVPSLRAALRALFGAP